MALQQVMAETAPNDEVSLPAWAAAGRREALRQSGGRQMGWGRRADRPADW